VQSDLHITPVEAREALARILASPVLGGSERRKRLLEYLVLRTLADGGATLKEFTIGVEVYGRDPNKYEPREDAVVRVDIARLRTRLQAYYEKDGRGDPVRLELPRGSYVILFHAADPPRISEPSEPPRPRRSAKWVLIAICAAACAAGSWAVYSAYQRPAPIRSVVVLPLLDLSPNHGNEYLSDGLTDELTGQLAHIPGLRVVARTSAYAFKGKAQDIRTIAAMLHADAVVEGSVQRSGDRLRINVQLNRASDGYHVWSETYDRNAGDLFGVEDEITRAVAGAMRVRMASPAPHQGPVDEQVHTLYLQARYFWNKRTASGIQQALDLLAEAIRRDPSYALAYAAQADCYATLLGNEQMAPTEAVPKLEAAAHRALALDDSSGEAHAALGEAEFYYNHEPRASELEFQRAIDRNPNYATAFQWYGATLMIRRRFDEARTQFARAHELDPLALVIPAASALMDYFERRPAECSAEAAGILKMDSNFWMAHYLMGVCAKLDRNYPVAISELRNAYELSGHDQVTLSDLATVYAATGDRAAALRTIDQLRHAPPGQYVSPFIVASAYAALGDRKQMFAMLAEAERQHASGLMEIAVRPQYDSFRSDPEFQNLVARLNLPH